MKRKKPNFKSSEDSNIKTRKNISNTLEPIILSDNEPSLQKKLKTEQKKTNKKSIKYTFIFKNEKIDEPNYVEYKSILFEDINYSLDNTVVVKLENVNYDKVGKIKKLFKKKEENTIKILVEIQWYYTKYDVDVKKTAEFEDVIGDYEVFEPLSTDLQIVNIYDLRGIAKIVSEKEYDSQQETLQENYFLTRAKYDSKKKRIEPPISEWKKLCVCQMAWGPDFDYVRCDFCGNWIHSQCTCLSDEEIRKIETYKCKECLKKGKK